MRHFFVISLLGTLGHFLYEWTGENYLTGLRQNFDVNDVKDIIEKIEHMPLDEFLEIFNSDNDAKFEGLYAPNKKAQPRYVNSLKAVWLPNR